MEGLRSTLNLLLATVIIATAVGGAAPVRAEKSILWDETHGVYLLYHLDGWFSDLAALLTSEGYSLATTTAGVESVDLSLYDILVVIVSSAWDSPYTAGEVAAIQDFYAGGGCVLIVADSPDNPVANIQPVALAFGTTFHETGAIDATMTSFSAHEIFTGVSEIGVVGPAILHASPPSVEVAFYPSGHAGVTVVDTDGVVILPDINLMENSFLGDSDNQAFILNVFDYLAVGHNTPTALESWGTIKNRYR